MSLFRSEVIEKKRDENIFGNVVVISPVSFMVYTAMLVLFVLSLGAFLFFGQYANKETVKGAINPQSGLVKVYAPERGIVTSRRVVEGDEVTEGDVIFVVSTERHLNASDQMQAIVAEETQKSIAIVESQIEEEKSLSKLRKLDIQGQLTYIRQEIESIGKEITLHEASVAISGEEVERIDMAAKKRYVPKTEYTNSFKSELESKIGLEQLRRGLTDRKNKASQLSAELKQSPAKLTQGLLSYEKTLSELRQRLAETRGNRSYSIIAPSSGRVTSLVYNEGDTIKLETPLLTIMPKDVGLKADLYVPTQAAGFLHEGQEVNIRYDAFPYEKYGLYGGVIEQIPKNIMIPGEVEVPFEVKEPVYKVVVKLNSQTVMAFGREHFLQVGMLLQGDIIRDHSRIIDWVLQPLYSLKGRA
jgi:membrane fusion protein